MTEPGGAPRGGSAGEPRGAPRELHGRPTAAELVTATREYLRDQLLPEVSAGQVFYLRVAMNALAIVARQLTDASDGVPASRRLGWADDAELAAAIRAGVAPPQRFGELAAALTDDVTTRLRVANPRFLADYQPDEFEVDG